VAPVKVVLGRRSSLWSSKIPSAVKGDLLFQPIFRKHHYDDFSFAIFIDHTLEIPFVKLSVVADLLLFLHRIDRHQLQLHQPADCQGTAVRNNLPFEVERGNHPQGRDESSYSPAPTLLAQGS
jgi:hypothetical protein